jgi:hypothetical protein
MLFKTLLRPLAVACALTASLSACSSGTKPGDTNVETGHTKMRPTTHDAVDEVANGDSVTAGLERAGKRRPTGQELLKASGEAKDRDKDGIAD